MNKNKNTKKIEYGQNEITDAVKFVYVTIIFSAYLIFTHNKYFDITKTRFTFFVFVSMLFIISFSVAKVIEALINNEKPLALKTEMADYKSPVFFMVLFLICNTISFALSVDKKNSFYGESGRYMGYFMFLVICLVVIVISTGIKSHIWLYMLLLVTTLFSYAVAIGQQLGIDFMKYRDGISKKQFYKFISTFGNINIFASFVVMSLGAAIAICIFSDRKVYRIFAGIVTATGGMTIMIANSDSGYIGLFVVIVVLFSFALYEGQLKRMFICITGLAFGNFSSALLNRYVVKKYDRQGGIGKQGGIAQLFDNVKLAAVIFLAVLIVTVIVFLLGDRLKCLSKKRLPVIVFLSFVGVCVIAFFVIGKMVGIAALTFDYKWGTYRGYIWRKCVQLFNEAPMKNKLFGYGQETVRLLTVSSFHDEMLEVTGMVYDNAHNELLQYLLTIGFVGVMTYIGMVVSSFIYILKNENKNVISYISMAAIAGYFVQSIINLDQPITTPLFFVLLALGVGNTAYTKKVDKS